MRRGARWVSALPEALNSAFGPVVAVSATAFGVAQILQAIAGADQRLGLVTEHRTEVLPLALERLACTTHATPTSNALHQKGLFDARPGIPAFRWHRQSSMGVDNDTVAVAAVAVAHAILACLRRLTTKTRLAAGCVAFVLDCS